MRFYVLSRSTVCHISLQGLPSHRSLQDFQAETVSFPTCGCWMLLGMIQWSNMSCDFTAVVLWSDIDSIEKNPARRQWRDLQDWSSSGCSEYSGLCGGIRPFHCIGARSEASGLGSHLKHRFAWLVADSYIASGWSMPARAHTLIEAQKNACVLTSKFPCLESERTCYGEDRGCFCNYTSWLQRGWCRAELWCRLLSNRPDTHVILLHSTRDATWMKQDFCLVVPFCRKRAHKQKSNFEERLCCGSLTGLGSKICQQALHCLPTCSWFRNNFPLVTLLQPSCSQTLCNNVATLNV